MYTTVVKNFQQGFIETLKEILDNGASVTVRDQKTKELQTMVMEIQNPCDRIICMPHRNNNIFATIAETLWVLGGRNDIAFLSRYLPRAADFSDDGLVWRAGYGARLRNWHKVDQIFQNIELLNEDKTSRRAVMSIFDPAEDFVDSKDVPCLAGDTILESPESKKTLKELSDDFSAGKLNRYPIYAFDTATKDMVLTWCTKVWKSGHKSVIKLHFDDGTTLMCTEDHKLFRKIFRDKFYCEERQAKDFSVGDRVWATQLFTTKKGYKTFKRNLNINTCYSNMQKVHNAYSTLVEGQIGSDIVVHHIDEDKSNNSISNLKRFTTSEHNAYHRIVNNPMQHMSKEQHEKRAKKQSESLKKYWENAPKSRHKQQSEIGKAKIRNNTTGKFCVNHVITAIEYVPNMIDVYDFEVEQYHNAMLNNGIFVHNCNNWIHTMIRHKLGGDFLHMTVSVRSNDAIWGASGINWFEWSVLMELMAMCTRSEIGNMVYLADSYHIYDKHFDRAQKMTSAPLFVGMYQLGFNSIPINTKNIEVFDMLTRYLLRIIEEDRLCDSMIYEITDDFLRECGWMLQLYKVMNEPERIVTLIAVAFQHLHAYGDFRLAALEYLHRQDYWTELLSQIDVTKVELEFLSQFETV